MAGIKLSGFKEFRGRMRTLPAEIKKEVGGETFAAAKSWERMSKQLAPVDQGRIRGAIRGNQVKETVSEVTCPVFYAPYIEFGTKRYVSIPAGLQAYAAQFRGGGQRGARFELQKNLFAWMDRVGIPDESQWFVYITIIVNGIKPHPFFFPPSPIIEKEFIKNVRNILNTEH